MNNPFMSILTPTYKRPLKLQVCKKSVDNQTDQDCQHFTMVDDKGIMMIESL